MDRNGVLSISFVASHRRLSLNVLSQPSNGTLAPQHEILAPPRSTFFYTLLATKAQCARLEANQEVIEVERCVLFPEG